MRSTDLPAGLPSSYVAAKRIRPSGGDLVRTAIRLVIMLAVVAATVAVAQVAASAATAIEYGLIAAL